MKKLITLLCLLLFVNVVMAQLTAAEQQDFKNSKTFITNSSFTVPKGVTRILVEVWGGGGGGSTAGGGGGGAYGKSILSVPEGSVVQVIVGTGGTGGEGASNSGQNTAVNYKPVSSPASTYVLMARGGSGTQVNSGSASNGVGGVFANSTGGDVNVIFQVGQDGQLFEDNYQQNGTATIVTRHYGNGGNAGNTQYTGGRGDVANITTGNTIIGLRMGTDGKLPGGGGGGGSRRGGNGANGMVIIYY